MKFLHAADLHLDSPLCGLERYEGAPVERLRGATRGAMENLVDLCLAEEVDFVLLAGDLYDGDWRDYSTGLFFAAQISRLRQAEVPVLWMRGNHDAASIITKHLRLPPNSIELSSRKAETRILEDLGVAVHGQGFSKRAVTDDLASGYPEPIDGLFNIGLLHTCVSGRPGHEPYAPCRLETLVAKGYDYWALGHVHAREVLHERPWIVFPGNLQGRHVRETGAKGASLVQVRDGVVQSVVHQALDVLRWARVEVDAAEAVSADDVVDLVRIALESELVDAEGRPLAARVRVSGASRAHDELMRDVERWRNALRLSATDIAPDSVWLEKIEIATDPLLDLSALGGREDAIGMLARSLRDLRADPDRLAALAESFADIRGKLPPELRSPEDDLLGESALSAAVDDVERLLLSRLVGGGDNE